MKYSFKSLLIIISLFCFELKGQTIIKVSKSDFPLKTKLAGEPILTDDNNQNLYISNHNQSFK